MVTLVISSNVAHLFGKGISVCSRVVRDNQALHDHEAQASFWATGDYFLRM